MFTNISIAALFAGLAAAYHAPVGEPSGNPITRPLNEIIPAGKPFEITWQPTTSNTVSLVFLKGPAINVIPQGAIVEGIPNSGKFLWTPPAGVEASTGPNGYGIQLIDDVTGQYQYSTQFGISAAAAAPVESKPVVDTKPAEVTKPAVTSGYAAIPAPTTVKTSTSTPCTTTTAYVPGTTGSAQPPKNGTAPYPTGALPPKPSAPAGNTTAPFFPGAASGLQAGVGLAGAAAALVLLL